MITKSEMHESIRSDMGRGNPEVCPPVQPSEAKLEGIHKPRTKQGLNHTLWLRPLKIEATWPAGSNVLWLRAKLLSFGSSTTSARMKVSYEVPADIYKPSPRQRGLRTNLLTFQGTFCFYPS